MFSFKCKTFQKASHALLRYNRARCSTGKETGKAVIWQGNHKDLARHEEEKLNKPEDNLSKELRRIGNEVDEILFAKPKGNLNHELEFIKERLQSEK